MAQYMTQEQIDNCKIIFNVFDKNGDGVIDLAELGSVFKALDLEVTQQELRDSISDIDFDQNGVVDFPEFLALVAQMMTNGELNDSDESLRETFDALDTDKNGFITPGELREMLLKLGERVSDEEVHSMIREADSDGDGQVSFEEFKNLMLSR